MITETEQKFLDSLAPEKLNRIVNVEPWDKGVLNYGEQLVGSIKQVVPNLEVVLMGSTVFHIAGERDVDITIYCQKEEQAQYINPLAKLLGKHTSEGAGHTGWAFDKDGTHVTVYMSDLRSPNTQRQKNLYEALKANPELVKQYEQVKLAMNGKTYKEYQTAKYEFYNQVLGADKV